MTSESVFIDCKGNKIEIGDILKTPQSTVLLKVDRFLKFDVVTIDQEYGFKWKYNQEDICYLKMEIETLKEENKELESTIEDLKNDIKNLENE